MRKLFEIVGKWAYYIVLVLVVLLMVNNIISRSDKVFDVIGVRFYIVLTGSMEPDIMPGDLAMIKSVDTKKLEVDDVITFKYKENTVTHRIIKKVYNGFVTKGDNNNVKDSEIVLNEDIIGEVVTVIPKLGYLVVFVSRPLIIVILLVLLGLIILKESLFSKDENENNYESKNIN